MTFCTKLLLCITFMIGLDVIQDKKAALEMFFLIILLKSTTTTTTKKNA